MHVRTIYTPLLLLYLLIWRIPSLLCMILEKPGPFVQIVTTTVLIFKKKKKTMAVVGINVTGYGRQKETFS